MNESEQLEREAITLIRQYGLFLPKPAKAFFKRLAVYLKWNQLEKSL